MSTKFPITVTPIIEREEIISHEKNNSVRNYRIYEYRSTAEDIPIIRVPISLLLYRVANYRTTLYQIRWIKAKGVDVDFFTLGEEFESIQKIQHEFLRELAQNDKESVTSIIDVLKREGQRVPLLITSTGIVVNGNRRLAAMRELLEAYPSFSHVDCMVLSNAATEDDFKEIEVRLQMTPETRMPYDWIGECLAIKDLIARSKSFEDIGNWMRLDPTKVKNKLLLLNEIDLYLKDWKNEEANYDQLNDAEEIVAQISKRVKVKEGLQQELARRIGWILLDQRGKDGRIYELRDVTGNLVGEVAAKINEVYSSEIALVDNSATDGKEVIELDIEDNESNTSEQALINFLDSCRNNDQMQQEIVNLCKVVVETKKVQKSGEAARRLVSEAHTSLLEVDLGSADKSTYEAIRRQLEGITQRVAILQNQLTLLQSQ